jgi:hypothetical protein
MTQLEWVDEQWTILLDPDNGEASDTGHPRHWQWCDAALRLMIAADEASADIGSFTGTTPVRAAVQEQHLRNTAPEAARPGRILLPHLPYSLTLKVPPGEACVQPKAQAPQLGCTLRSLSHHLALLPPSGSVCTSWLFGKTRVDAAGPDACRLNVLVVPFPYSVPDGCLVPRDHVRHALIESQAEDLWRQAGCPPEGPATFRPRAEALLGPRTCYFGLRQRWLLPGGQEVSARQFADFLGALLAGCRRAGSPAHLVILPELSLGETLARETARLLAPEHPELELFMAGVASADPLPRNQVYGCVLKDGKFLHDWKQSKHHRWRLDRGQIERYRLQRDLSPESFWWEEIDIERRACAFYAFRPRACLAALICEDLARIEPVQTVIRSVGPNLLIALLFDGPQKPDRWPGRYATVLAEDPGCAVLTVTSLGLMRRQSSPGEEMRQVALWKEPDPGLLVDAALAEQQRQAKNPRSLWLATGTHGLLLRLRLAPQHVYTLDGRRAREDAVTVVLPSDGVQSIAHPAPPPWAQ